jgi:hypothetical protein
MNDYRCRVQIAYDHLIDNRPAAINTVRAAAGAAPDDIKKEGINDMALFFKHQLFLAGIKEPIRDRVLEDGKATFKESMKLARELEAIHNDKRRSHKIAAIKTAIGPEEAATIFWDKIADEDLDKVAAVHQNRVPRPAPRSAPAAAPTVNAAPLRSKAPANLMWFAAIARRKGTCSVSVTPDAETALPWWMRMARSTRAASTMSLRRTTPWIKLGPNTKMRTLGLLPI